MIDIHSHILPGIDDGSENFSDSVKMLRIAEKNNITDIIATPHSYSVNRLFDEPGKVIESGVADFAEKAVSQSLNIRIHPGEEILYDENTLSDLKSGKSITLCNSRYTLIEFMPDESSKVITEAIDLLLTEGYFPIIAHPERYFCIQRDITRAYKMKDSGALFQVNSQSIFGLFGRESAEVAKHLIFGMDADFVASDSHNPYFRSPELSELHEIISVETDFRYANKLVLDNPLKIINNEDIYPIGRRSK